MRVGGVAAYRSGRRHHNLSKAEINIGIIPTFGGRHGLPRNIKPSSKLILTGRTFDAAEAACLGLIKRVVPAADLLEALWLASLLATKPPLTLAAVPGAIDRGMDAAIDGGLAIEEAAFARIAPTHDARRGSRIRRKAASNISRTMMIGARGPVPIHGCVGFSRAGPK
jgi:enoyl-CoA hydratase/carnithine racemase